MVRQKGPRRRLTSPYDHRCDEPNTLHVEPPEPSRFAHDSAAASGCNAEWNRCSGAEYTPRKSRFQRKPMTCLSKIGRASCRERVEISVVAVSLEKKKKEERADRRGGERVESS